MKKFIKVMILIVLGAAIGVAGTCLVYFLTVGDVAWQVYLKEKLVPNIVFILTSIGTICLAALPIVKTVSTAVEKFNKVTKDVSDTVENNGKNTSRINNLEERLTRIENSTTNIEEIARIGFCNMDELVRKGYAQEIQKVGKDDE